MSSQVIKRFTAWSFSRWKAWATCPLKAKLNHLDKILEPPNKAMTRGSDIHKQAELLVKAGSGKIPDALKLFEKDFKKLCKTADVKTEEQWAFDKNWAPTGWFDRDCWCRMVVDAYYIVELKNGIRRAVIIDYKTGRMREENNPQLGLYALGAFRKFGCTEAVCEFWYLDQGEKVSIKFKADEEANIIEAWQDRVLPMLADTIFPPRPNPLCKWCFYSKTKNGNCQF